MKKGVISILKHKQDKDWNDTVIHEYDIVVGDDMGSIAYFGDQKVDAVGDTIEYEAEQTQYGVKIKKPRAAKSGAFSGGGAGRKPQDVRQNFPSYAISYTKDLVVADKIDIKLMAATAERMFDIMLDLHSKLPASAPAAVATAAAAEKKTTVPDHANPKIQAAPPSTESPTAEQVNAEAKKQQEDDTDDLPF